MKTYCLILTTAILCLIIIAVPGLLLAIFIAFMLDIQNETILFGLVFGCTYLSMNIFKGKAKVYIRKGGRWLLKKGYQPPWV